MAAFPRTFPTCARGAARAWLLACAASTAFAAPGAAEPAGSDRIGDWLNRARPPLEVAQGVPAETNRAAPAAQPRVAPVRDPREGDPEYEQAQKLMKAVNAILEDAARDRNEAKKLPSENEFIMKPLWTETREDREKKVRDLLDAALGVVTDVPIVDVQKKIEGLRKSIRDLEDRIVKLREKQLAAPQDGVLPGLITDTVDSLGKDIEEIKKRIELNRAEIKSAKGDIRAGLAKGGIELAPEQVDLLLDSVLSGDLVRLVAVFGSAKIIDAQLAKLMTASGENLGAARRYFAMHAALFAMLVHAQDVLVSKIDKQYLPKLTSIEQDIRAARGKTAELLRAENRDDQRRVLENNRESQRLADDAAKGYRRYLTQQRDQIARARQRATHDLRIADNTFETVEASFELKILMQDSSASFEALQRLEAPTFDQIFRNEELRREFENLTRKLDAPAS
jgi:hypothetical protein